MSAHSITQLRYKFFAPVFLRLIFSRKIQIQRCQTFILSPTHSSATEDFVGYTFAFTTLYSVHCTAFGEI